VAVSQTNIFVADRGARQVLVFDRGFRYQRSFALPLPAGTGAVAPFAIAVEPDGTLLLADTRWPRLLHANADGSSLPEVALGGTDNPRFAGLRLAQRFSPEGEAIIGPLDGQDHDIAWHEIIVEADLPEGTALSLQTYASNTASPAATPPWAPDAPVPIPQAAEGDRMAGGQCGEFRRLVLPAPSAGQATDRGRYLWLRLRFFGRKQRESDEVASATPALRSLRALGPRLSYLSYLPAIYSRRDPAADAPGALFLERYLTLFERVLTGIEESYEEVSRLLNLDATTPEWLSWLASWLGLALDPSWPLDRRRQLLGNALALYRLRGTPEGLSRYVEIYSGSRPELMEGFRTRARPAGVLGQSWVLGCVPVGDGSACLPGARSGGAHRFRLYAYVDDGCAKEKVEAAVRAIVDANKPAHTDYDLCIVRPDARVGLQSTVGLDLVVGGSPPEPSILGEGRTRTGAEPRPVLGKNLFLGGDAPALHTAAGLPLDAVAPPVLDDDFTLT
jgi:phage tail-like protein